MVVEAEDSLVFGIGLTLPEDAKLLGDGRTGTTYSASSIRMISRSKASVEAREMRLSSQARCSARHCSSVRPASVGEMESLIMMGVGVIGAIVVLERSGVLGFCCIGVDGPEMVMMEEVDVEVDSGGGCGALGVSDVKLGIGEEGRDVCSMKREMRAGDDEAAIVMKWPLAAL